MYTKLKTYTAQEIDTLLKPRKPGVKIGEKMKFIFSPENLEAQLLQSKSKFVLLGVPEDAGVSGNYGVPGSRHAWPFALKALLNMQSNDFCKAGKLLLLGYLNFETELDELDRLKGKEAEYIEKSRALTSEIDKELTFYIQLIVASGKKPIIIGGGHNNCYGIIKGCALALNNPINVLNVDAHTDLRPIEGRHSGNGFTYAYKEGFLGNYFVFGLHENYLSNDMLKMIEAQKPRIKYMTFEEVKLKSIENQSNYLKKIKDFVDIDAFGLEIDCDAIANIPSSAMTPTGLTVEEVRKIIYTIQSHKNATYLHICEAAPDINNEREQVQTGKLIAYLITDFIRK